MRAEYDAFPHKPIREEPEPTEGDDSDPDGEVLEFEWWCDRHLAFEGGHDSEFSMGYVSRLAYELEVGVETTLAVGQFIVLLTHFGSVSLDVPLYYDDEIVEEDRGTEYASNVVFALLSPDQARTFRAYLETNEGFTPDVEATLRLSNQYYGQPPYGPGTADLGNSDPNKYLDVEEFLSVVEPSHKRQKITHA